MFLSESMMRAIHADRVRDIERTTRERRMIEARDLDEGETAPDRAAPATSTGAVRRSRTSLPA